MFILVAGIAFGRIYVSRQQKKEREAQQQMFRDLSRMQSKQADSMNKQIQKDNEELQKTQMKVDSMMRKLEKQPEEFNKKFGLDQEQASSLPA